MRNISVVFLVVLIFSITANFGVNAQNRPPREEMEKLKQENGEMPRENRQMRKEDVKEIRVENRENLQENRQVSREEMDKARAENKEELKTYKEERKNAYEGTTEEDLKAYRQETVEGAKELRRENLDELNVIREQRKQEGLEIRNESFEKIKELKETTNTERCEKITTNLQSRVEKYNQSFNTHIEKYNEMYTKLQGISTQMALLGLDTSVLDSYLVELSSMISDFELTANNTLEQLSSVASAGCTEDPEGFKASMDAVKVELQNSRNKLSSIKTYFKGTIKPELENLKTQAESLEESESTTTE